MAFFDKLKEAKDSAMNAATQATQKAKEAYETNKQASEEKKAQKAAYEQEMKQKAAQEGEARSADILGKFNGTGLFEGIDMNTLMNFTNEFYSKIVLPAGSLATTCIDMFHYIDERVEKKIKKTFPSHSTEDDNDTVLLYLRAEKKTEVILTKSRIAFSEPLADDKKFYVEGSIPLSSVSSIVVEHSGDTCDFLVNGVKVLSLDKKPVFERDFISIERYIEMIEKRDFNIQDEEVDAIIREKIGAKVYEEVKRKMTYDDELLLYFAWGLDDLTAKDYMFCTDKQIVYLDRAALGATADVKQFYYEDINSMATKQNSEDTSLTGYLIDTALTSALQICDLEITVAGSTMKISTLKKREADRVVEIYHQMRKSIKENANKPQQVVVQQQEADPLEQLEKLSKLKDAGIISEDEFNQKKMALLEKL